MTDSTEGAIFRRGDGRTCAVTPRIPAGCEQSWRGSLPRNPYRRSAVLHWFKQHVSVLDASSDAPFFKIYNSRHMINIV